MAKLTDLMFAIPRGGVHRTRGDSKRGRQMQTTLNRNQTNAFTPHQGQRERLRRLNQAASSNKPKG